MPKPLVEIGERPILWHIMKLYGAPRRSTASSLCLGYKSWEIKEYFLRYREHVARLHGPHRQRATRRRSTTARSTRTGRSPAPRPGSTTGTGARLRRVRRLHRHRHVHVHLRRRHRPTSTSRRCSTSTARTSRIGTVTGVHPTLALRRDARSTDGVVDRVQREADDARGLRQRRLLRLPARVLRLPRRRPGADPRAGAAAATSRATASSRCTATRGSGWGWTPTASSPSSTSCGRRARRPGRSGSAEA